MNSNILRSDELLADGCNKGRRCDGSVLLVTFGIAVVLISIVAVTLHSTTNKYVTAYQWASWQEALQGAESAADLAMANMRADAQRTAAVAGGATPTATPWVGWTATNGGTSWQIGSDGTYLNNQGTGNGNVTTFYLNDLRANKYTSVSYNYAYTSANNVLTKHAGEGNNNLRFGVSVDAPPSLLYQNSQWIRVRSWGSTDLSGPIRVSEEKLDNRIRKLGLFFDKVSGLSNLSSGHGTITRKIELVAKPVSLFAGALTAMVQLKTDKNGLTTNSFNSEDSTNWPLDPTTLTYNMALHTNVPTDPLGKNGDVASNAFPIQHDHSFNLDTTYFKVWGDIGNNYSQIQNADPNNFGESPTINNPLTGNADMYKANPNPTLIQTKTGSNPGDWSGNVETNYYRDLPPIPEPNWTIGNSTKLISTITTISSSTPDLASNQVSTDPANPTRINATSLQLANKDTWTIHAPPMPAGWKVGVPPAIAYVQIHVTGDIKLDDGGRVVIEDKMDAQGNEQAKTQVQIYFDRNVKIGETKETKTNMGGFDLQSDDAKDLLLLGVTQPDTKKMPADQYVDPLGNGATYTPYKASGNVLFKENDFTGAIYAPDHNILFENTPDGRGKRHKRGQAGNEFYGSYVGRTLDIHGAHSFHYDESLNDWGPSQDWSYVSWFEDVDVDNR